MIGRLEVREVRDHERVARSRGELLHDARDVEVDDVEATGGAVEHAQVEQIAEVQLVVGDRLLGDEDRVGARAQTRERRRRGPAEEVRVPERRTARDRVRVDPERVLEVGADVRVRVIDRGRPADARYGGDLRLQAPLCCYPGRRRCRDVAAERELSVDVRLLVVGRSEQPELDPEREQ